MIKIREINLDDNAGVKKLINKVMEEEFPQSANTFGMEDIENSKQYYGGKKETFFVAEKDGKIVGTVGIKRDTDHDALLRRLFVAKDYRGKGYGSKLINEAVSFCKKHGYKKLLFRGTDAMKAAYKTCTKNGFKEHDILNLPHVKMFILEMSI